MGIKKLIVLFMATALTAVTAADCSGGQKETATEITKGTETAATAEATTAAKMGAAETVREVIEAVAGADEENYGTKDASEDNTRNQDEIDENEPLVVSSGTSCNNSRRLAIGAAGNAIGKTFLDFAVRRGFTSQIVIDHVKSRGDVAINNVDEALNRAEKSGIRDLVIQSTHPIGGLEYVNLVNEMVEYSSTFKRVAIGKPPLTADDDFGVVMKAVTGTTARYDDGEAAICSIGHDAEMGFNQVCARMQDMLTGVGYRNYYVNTVEAAPGLDDALTTMRGRNYRKVVLEPLVIIADNHASNDMVGDGKGSWGTTFEDVDYEVTYLINELSGLETIKQLFIKHAQATADSLTE